MILSSGSILNPILRYGVKGNQKNVLRCPNEGRLVFIVACGALFPHLGAESLPKLDQGAIAINANRLPSVRRQLFLPASHSPEAVQMTTSLEQIVRDFPRDRYRRQPHRQGRNCDGLRSKRVLEVGCGDGAYSIHRPDRLSQVQVSSLVRVCVNSSLVSICCQRTRRSKG